MAPDRFEMDVTSTDNSGDWNDWKATSRKCIVECIGTLFLTYIGSMSFLIPIPVIGAAFAHGFVLFVLVVGMGHISGGHYNSAVSLGAALSGALHPITTVVYILSQMLGAFIGGLFLRASLNIESYMSITGGTTNPGSLDLIGQAIFVEGILTYLLVSTVLNAAVDNEGKDILGALGIGCALFVSILAGGNVSGASLNPARSFGPAVAYTFFYDSDYAGLDSSEVWKNHYIYWVGPILGAAVAALIYKLFLAEPQKRWLFK